MRAVTLLVLVGCSATESATGTAAGTGAGTETAAETETAPEPAPEETVRIASYNVNVAMVAEDSVAALEGLDADIVLLQEVGRDWEAVLEKRFARYPHVAIERWDQQRWGGLAALSRFPFRDAEVLEPKKGPFPAWRAVFATPLGDLEILNVHLYPPIRLSRANNWLEAYRKGQAIHVRELGSFFPSLGDGAAIIAGDLNEDAAGDGVRWLSERDFAPAHRAGHATWRWPTQIGEIKWQLDHILVRGPLEVVAAEVIEAGASDHYPIVAELRRSRGLHSK